MRKALLYIVFVLLSSLAVMAAGKRVQGDRVATMWWVLWNSPENCGVANQCGEADYGKPAAGFSLVYATGTRMKKNDRVTFAATLATGGKVGVLFGDGLQDPDNAEVHMVIRTHGPIIPYLLTHQMTSLEGGCPPNECEDVQVAMHQSRQADLDGHSTVVVYWLPEYSIVYGASAALWRSPEGLVGVFNTQLP